MTEQEQVQDPYTSYVNVKIVDLWHEVYMHEYRSINKAEAKSSADAAVADFKSFLKGE